MRTVNRGILSLSWCVAISGASLAQSPTEFYKARTISIVVGIEQGTGFDLYGRTLAQHIGRQIPGNPTVIVNNMPGASGLVAFNWLANVAPKDGTVFATASFSVPFEPIFGNESARFKGPEFNWIGNMDSGVSVCLARADSGVANWADLMERELTIGAAGRAGPLSQIPRALIALGGVRLNLIEGYIGSASIKLATERKEVQGVCGLSLSTMRSQWTDLTESGVVRMTCRLARSRTLIWVSFRTFMSSPRMTPSGRFTALSLVPRGSGVPSRPRKMCRQSASRCFARRSPRQ